MKNCSQCKNWVEPNKANYKTMPVHYACQKLKCMTCRETGASYNADKDCFEEREEEI